MAWGRVAASEETAALTETVFPAPTSPVTTPMADSTMQKLMRATASWCAWRMNRSLAAMDLPKGVRSRPKWATHGARLTSSAPRARLGTWRAGRSRSSARCPRTPHGRLPPCRGSRSPSGQVWPGPPGERPVGVAARDARCCRTGLGAVQVDVDSREVLGVVSELDAPPDEGWVDAIGVALEGDCRRAGHPSRHRPPEGLSQLVGVDLAVGTGPLEAVDRRLVGLRVYATVGHLLGPGEEQVVQLLERGDALMGRLGQEGLPDVAVEPFLLAAAFWRIGLGARTCKYVNTTVCFLGTAAEGIGGAAMSRWRRDCLEVLCLAEGAEQSNIFLDFS